jgi:hypothetical protein
VFGVIIVVLLLILAMGALGWLSKGFADWNIGTWFEGWFSEAEQAVKALRGCNRLL